MSRIGLMPIAIPEGVVVKVESHEVSVTGPLATLAVMIPRVVQVSFDEANRTVALTRTTETKNARALHGTARSRIANIVKGVTEGFTKTLEIGGVGYQAKVEGKNLVLQIGFSHPVKLAIPEGLKIETPSPTKIVCFGPDKQEVGQFAAVVRAVRPPEPYKGKGIRYSGEHVRRKQGKTFAGGE